MSSMVQPWLALCKETGGMRAGCFAHHLRGRYRSTVLPVSSCMLTLRAGCSDLTALACCRQRLSPDFAGSENLEAAPD